MTPDAYANAMKDIAEVFMFEQWLRHYFVVEKGDTLFLEIPQDDYQAIFAQEEHLAPLADMLNHTEISYEKCQVSVCAFVGTRYDGSKYGPDIVSRAMDSKAFKIEMYVFSVWLKGHETFLDERRMPFSEWREMYAEWNALQEVKEYRLKLQAGGGDPNVPPSKSVH